MIHDKIFVREDGTKVKITVSLHVDWSRPPMWKIDVSTCEPRRRTWDVVGDIYSMDYRFMKSQIEKRKAMLEDQLKVVTAEEIHEVKLECWEKLRPEL